MTPLCQELRPALLQNVHPVLGRQRFLTAEFTEKTSRSSERKLATILQHHHGSSLTKSGCSRDNLKSLAVAGAIEPPRPRTPNRGMTLQMVRRFPRLYSSIFLFAVLTLLSILAFAEGTRTWEQSKFDDLV